MSLSRPFRQGAAVDALIREGLLHPHLRERTPATLTHLYGHQERALRAIAAGLTTLVATGTGSGKTECFLYSIVSRCLCLRDDGAPPGVSAVIVYPMNALAEDQLMRLRGLLGGHGDSVRDARTAPSRMPAVCSTSCCRVSSNRASKCER